MGPAGYFSRPNKAKNIFIFFNTEVVNFLFSVLTHEPIEIGYASEMIFTPFGYS